MIWFACSKCAKVHGRAENAIGAMIFCECGQGLSVPWESTAPEPAQLPATAAPTSGTPPLRVEPLSFGEVSRPPRAERPRPAPAWEGGERERVSEPPPRVGRRGPRFQFDPNLCFNHDGRAKQKVCDECDLPFCDDCVVAFRGRTLCGPCKNHESKLLQRPPLTYGLAIASCLGAIAAGILLFCLLPVSRSSSVPWLMVFPFALEVAALV